jgi:NADP-dependent 3-hydroxy acid dehydrogenase YdfG
LFHSQKAVLYVQKVNIRNRKDAKAWIAKPAERLGPLKGTANLSLVTPKYHDDTHLADQVDEEWDSMFDINVKGLVNCMRAELRYLTERDSIINAGSALALQGRDAAAVYADSTHAVVRLASYVVKETGEKGMRVECATP